MDKEKCISCAKIIANDISSVKLKCPNCGEIIIRCSACRSKGTEYKCKCGFVGP